MDQQHLGGVADGGAAGFGVFDDVQRHVLVGAFIHIDMADAGTGLDAGHQCILDTGVDEAGTAPGNQQIHQAHGLHQHVDAVAAGVLNHAHAVLGQSCRRQSLPQSVGDGVGRGEGFLAAPENADIAALQGQCRRVGGDIGAALVDDGHHAHGDGGLFNAQAVGPLDGFQNLPHRVRQLRHLTDTLHHAVDAGRVQPQPVQHHLGHGPPGGGHVLLVGQQNVRLMVQQRVGHGGKGLVLLFRGGPQQGRTSGLGGL